MENKVKFYAVIVIYNTEISQSETCNNICKILNHDIEVIIVDNSIITNNNAELSQNNGWRYLNMHGNKGLSKAYNAVLDFLNGKDGVVIWFDDDTNVTQQYFDSLEEAVLTKKQCDIFAPMIQGQDGKFWSPNEYHYLKNKQLKSSDQKIDNRKFNAINSCTAVRLKVYDQYRYDERLFLDQVDHDFFEKQRKLKRSFYKLDVIIQHNFSTKQKGRSLEDLKMRYSIMIPDFLTFCNKSFCRRFLGYVKVIGWGVRESIRNKQIYFFFWCIKMIFKFIRGNSK
jgi:GT2 family glycosyltransferase